MNFSLNSSEKSAWSICCNQYNQLMTPDYYSILLLTCPSMKSLSKVLCTLLCIFFYLSDSVTQNTTIAHDAYCINCATTADPSAVLDIRSSDKGLLIPRVTNTSAVINPANALMIYDNSDNNIKLYNGTLWRRINEVDHISFPSSSTFVGINAGFGNGGFSNTAFGNSALYSIATGGYRNTAIGQSALYTNSTGYSNTALGYFSLYSNTSGKNNIAVGEDVLYANTTGQDNTAIGNEAMSSNTTGYSNTSYGRLALFHNTTGSNNVANGNYSLYNNTSGWGNVANGSSALSQNSTGTNNVANGSSALSGNKTGSYNIANGADALGTNDSGSYNVVNGHYAMYDNDTGDYNVASGERTMYSNTSGSYNTANGYKALHFNTSGEYNTANGTQAMYNNISGNDNTANGRLAMYSNSTGSFNVAIGRSAMRQNTTGNNNTAIGYIAFFNGTNYSNATAVGFDAQITGSNKVRLGNASVTEIGGYANWSNVSDARFKTEVRNNVPGLDFIGRLNPVTYQMDMNAIAQFHKSPDSRRLKKAESEKSIIRFTGFLAQDVDRAAQSIGYDFSGIVKPKHEQDNYSLRYAEFVVPLVKAVQELEQKNTALREAYQNSKTEKDAEIAELKSRLSKIEALLLK